MSANIQIDLAVLDSLVANQTQSLFNSKCLPSVSDSLFLDGVEVQGISHTIQSDRVSFIITAQVLVTTQAFLDASIGGDPEDEAFTITISIELGVVDVPQGLNMPTGKGLKLTCTGITAPSPELQLAAASLVSTLGVLGFVDLTPTFTLLTIIPSEVVFEAVENEPALPNGLFIWLSPQTTIVNHLGQFNLQWCLYVDAKAMDNLMTNTLVKAMIPQLEAQNAHVNLAATASEWAPIGLGAPTIPIPHVNSEIQASGTNTLIPFTVNTNFKIDFYLENNAGFLIQFINWAIDIEVPFLIDPVLTIIAQNRADSARDGIVANFNPAIIPGGSRLGEPGTDYGDHNFQVTSALPSISLGTAAFSYTYCVGFSDGMVVGGAVDVGPGPSAGFTEIIATQFPTLYDSLLDCQTQKILSTTIQASASSSPDFSIGAFCEATITAPSITGLDLSPYLYADPADSASDRSFESITVYVIFPDLVAYQVANNKQNVVVRINTTRGVRMVNLGIPPVPQFDQSGQITNTTTVLLNDCTGSVDLWIKPYSITARAWPFKPAVAWADRPDRVAAFESALITVSPSSGPVIFKQPRDGGMTIIHGSREGEYVIPTLVAVRSYDEGGSLETMNRSSLGKVATRSKLFRRVAQFRKSESISHELVGGKRVARILSTFADGIEQTQVDGFGIVTQAARQKLSNSVQLEKVRNETVLPNIAGYLALHPVPGFEDQPTSIAELSDGSFRVVSRTNEGYEVTGLVPRWIRGLTVSGDWAISTTKCGKVTVFQVHETSKGDCTCKCKCGGREAEKV